MREADVDVVIPWVNGDDPLHRDKLGQYLGNKASKPPKAAQATRYADRGELEFCVSSILKFAPWVRRIYLLTDNQVPDFFPQGSRSIAGGRICLVDHKEIFEGHQELLPTFNSLSIETMVWRIRGLANRFIYFNDDLSLINPVDVSDFFLGEHVVLRGAWSKVITPSFSKRVKMFLGTARSTHGAAQCKGAQLANPGADSFLMTGHIPQPLKRSTFDEFFAKHEELLVKNAKHKLRHVDQFWPISLAHHIEISRKTADIKKNSQYLYLSPNEMDTTSMIGRLKAEANNGSNLFMCMQSLDQCDGEFYSFWKEWMRDRIGTLESNLNGSSIPDIESGVRYD